MGAGGGGERNRFVREGVDDEGMGPDVRVYLLVVNTHTHPYTYTGVRRAVHRPGERDAAATGETVPPPRAVVSEMERDQERCIRVCVCLGEV